MDLPFYLKVISNFFINFSRIATIYGIFLINSDNLVLFFQKVLVSAIILLIES